MMTLYDDTHGLGLYSSGTNNGFPVALHYDVRASLLAEDSGWGCDTPGLELDAALAKT